MTSNKKLRTGRNRHWNYFPIMRLWMTCQHKKNLFTRFTLLDERMLALNKKRRKKKKKENLPSVSTSYRRELIGTARTLWNTKLIREIKKTSWNFAVFLSEVHFLSILDCVEPQHCLTTKTLWIVVACKFLWKKNFSRFGCTKKLFFKL